MEAPEPKFEIVQSFSITTIAGRVRFNLTREMLREFDPGELAAIREITRQKIANVIKLRNLKKDRSTNRKSKNFSPGFLSKKFSLLRENTKITL